jgi:hypothetical protein
MPTGLSNGNFHVNQSYRERVQAWQEEAWEAERKDRLERKLEEERNVFSMLLELDPDGAHDWYADDRNVPAFGPVSERIELIQARIAELKGESSG